LDTPGETKKLVNKRIKENFFILSALNENNERVIIVDTNNDLDFTEENIYNTRYLKEYINNRQFIRITNIEYYNYKNDSVNNSEINIWPEIHKLSYKLNIDSMAHIEVVYQSDEMQSTSIGFSPYKFNIYKNSTKPFDSDNAKILPFTDPAKNNFGILSNFYNIGDYIEINGSFYVFQKISLKGDSLFLKKINYKSQPVGYRVNFKAPILKGSYLQTNERYTLSANKHNSYLLLYFWGTWCVPCKEMLPELKSFVSKNANVFNMVGIAYDYDSVKVINYINNNNISWATLFQKMGSRNSTNNYIDDFKVLEFPTLILIDKFGKIVFRKNGLMTSAEFINMSLDYKFN
jgi:thiol-disulfide isomerase/thioredoxin